MPVRDRSAVGYRRLAGLLRDQVLADRFAAGDPLPTELALATEHGLSRQTVRRAYLELVNEGLVYRVPGRGTFVTSSADRYGRAWASVTDLLELELDTELELTAAIGGAYDPHAVERLRLTSRVHHALGYRRRHRGELFCWTRVYLPADVGALLETEPTLLEVGRRSRTTVIGLIEARGIHIAEADQLITAVPASAEAAAHLGCGEGAPLLHMERLYLDPAGRPIELSISQYLPQHYSHRLLLGRHHVHHEQ
ncbi:MAG: GntR family transcriptional regulator [Frankiales bacterium]|nr:GntR family transcriptional regulator [Frankiales bacterium]